MAQLVDLDAVTSEDIRFKLNGKEYRVPGELEVEQMLRWIKIQEGWTKLAVRNQAVREALAEGSEIPDGLDVGDIDPQELMVRSKDEVLQLFRVYQPALKNLPFKSSQIGHVFGKLLGQLQEGTETADPTRPTPKRVRKPKS